MAVQTTKTNKPLNPRGNDQSPKGYNRAALYSGKALDFDGVNDVLSLDGYTTFTGDFSLSMYIKTSTILQRGLLTDSANNDALTLLTPDEHLMIRIDGINHIWDTGLPIYNDYMNHLVVVRSGSEVTPYLNGVSGNSVTATNGTFAFNQFGRQTTSANYFNGQAANIKAFDVALTAAQVADLYNNPEKVVPTGVDNTALKLWLPMQEGAGTTAYDGSGNGNHGTISGATYTHGIGAPVSQTAVIDWNKGANLLQYSEGFDNAYWTKSQTTVSANTTATLDPSGGNNADKVIPSTASIRHFIDANITGANQTASVFAKADGYSTITLFYTVHDGYATYNLNDGTITETSGSVTATIESFANGWYRCNLNTSLTTQNSIRFYIINGTTWGGDALNAGDGTSGVYLYGASLVNDSTAGPYVRTGATAQTSPVLLPQGLTSGRDITGVNLFENVRKQGALNLDGNSWAEVHDNASVDIGDAITLEAWVYWDTSILTGKGILGKWENSNQCYLLFKRNTGTEVQFYINGAYSTFDPMTDGWNHIVGTYDKVNRKLYINGELKDTDAYTAAITTSALPVEIGRYNQSSAVAYDDDIAQPRIYNRALTAEEVQRNYNAGKNTYTN